MYIELFLRVQNNKISIKIEVLYRLNWQVQDFIIILYYCLLFLNRINNIRRTNKTADPTTRYDKQKNIISVLQLEANDL